MNANTMKLILFFTNRQLGNKHTLYFQVCLIVWTILLGTISVTCADQLTFGREMRLVVLDPGHGGEDHGARGAEGVLEKDVSLALSRIIADACGDQYRIRLTRTGDYGLAIRDRTAEANRLKADLFISIHTGGSFRHSATGMGVYYQQASGVMSSTDKTQSVGSERPIPWDRIQDRHEAKSRILATQMSGHFKDGLKPSNLTLKPLPLAILKGADMPAILMEVGYITNPAEEDLMQDAEFLSRAAVAVCRGIGEFLNEH